MNSTAVTRLNSHSDICTTLTYPRLTPTAPRDSGLPDLPLREAPQRPEPDDGAQVFKLGQTTGWTRGQYSTLQAAHIIQPPKDHDDEHGKPTSTTTYTVITTKHTITGHKRCIFFSSPGDSGALVFDNKLRVNGLLIGGNQTHHAVSYITLVSDLFKDIKRKTGAVDVRVPL